MNPDYVLLLSAGMGTRMGAIGTRLPKPLWPVFEKSLLEIQLDYMQKYSPKRIFVNVHHCEELMIKELRKSRYKNITILKEPSLLGVGGSVHSVKKQEDRGQLLILNADQLYLLEESEEREFFARAANFGQCLLAVNVGFSDEYNKLRCAENDTLIKIEKSKTLSSTYSGVSLVNLESLDYTPGFSNFFDTVAKYKSSEVAVYSPKGEWEYWDFGTLHRYVDSINTISMEWCKASTSNMKKLLLHSNAVNPLKLGHNSYSGYCAGFYNFSDRTLVAKDGAIVFSLNESKEIGEKTLYYQDLEMSLAGLN